MSGGWNDVRSNSGAQRSLAAPMLGGRRGRSTSRIPMAGGARPSLLDQDAPLERGRQLLTHPHQSFDPFAKSVATPTRPLSQPRGESATSGQKSKGTGSCPGAFCQPGGWRAPGAAPGSPRKSLVCGAFGAFWMLKPFGRFLLEDSREAGV